MVICKVTGYDGMWPRKCCREAYEDGMCKVHLAARKRKDKLQAKKDAADDTWMHEQRRRMELADHLISQLGCGQRDRFFDDRGRLTHTGHIVLTEADVATLIAKLG